jgi:hypothetical protein
MGPIQIVLLQQMCIMTYQIEMGRQQLIVYFLG